jgi:phospholipid/cholesterol/gamma-HCH transport system substrate-binding protein
MQLQRNEIRTGLIVILTLALVVGVLLALGAPGVFNPMNTYYIFFDNAAGINRGAPVLLAGRKVGQVTDLHSPVPVAKQPPGKKYEVLIEVKIDKEARIYKKVHVRMMQYGLLGELVIDFARGDEASGLAESDTSFVGDRVPDSSEAVAKLMEIVKPLAAQTSQALTEVEQTASNLKRITAKGSDFDQAITRFKQVGGNVQKITDELLEDDRLQVSLENIRNASYELDETVVNARQFTDTIKRQPWRLIWPSTKKYPEDEARQEGEALVAERRPIAHSRGGAAPVKKECTCHPKEEDSK